MRVVTINHTSRPGTPKGSKAFHGRGKGIQGNSDQFNAPANLRIGDGGNGHGSGSAIAVSITSFKVIVVKIDFSQQAVAARRLTDSIVHTSPFQAENTSRAGRANAIVWRTVCVRKKTINRNISGQASCFAESRN